MERKPEVQSAESSNQPPPRESNEESNEKPLAQVILLMDRRARVLVQRRAA